MTYICKAEKDTDVENKYIDTKEEGSGWGAGERLGLTCTPGCCYVGNRQRRGTSSSVLVAQGALFTLSDPKGKGDPKGSGTHVYQWLSQLIVQ